MEQVLGKIRRWTLTMARLSCPRDSQVKVLTEQLGMQVYLMLRNLA